MCFMLLAPGCENNAGTCAPGERSKQYTTTSPAPAPASISIAEWDGQDVFRFTVKDRGDHSRPWLPVIYWGFENTKSVVGGKGFHKVLPVLGDALLNHTVMDGRYMSIDRQGTVTTARGTIPVIFYTVMPVTDPNKGGVIEMSGIATQGGDGEWTLQSAFERFRRKGCFESLDGASLKPQLMFLIHFPGLKRSGVIDADAYGIGDFTAESEATRIKPRT